MVADEFIFTGELGRHKENQGHKCFLLRNEEPARGSQMMSITKFTGILKF